MKKQKVFIPVEGENQPYDVIITKVSKNPFFMSGKEQEGYFFTTSSLENLIKECFEHGKNSFAHEIGDDTFEEDEIVFKNAKEIIESLNIK